MPLFRLLRFIVVVGRQLAKVNVGIVTTAGVFDMSAKQIRQCLGGGCTAQPGHLDFAAKVLLFEIKGQSAHPAVLHP